MVIKTMETLFLKTFIFLMILDPNLGFVLFEKFGNPFLSKKQISEMVFEA